MNQANPLVADIRRSAEIARDREKRAWSREGSPIGFSPGQIDLRQKSYTYQVKHVPSGEVFTRTRGFWDRAELLEALNDWNRIAQLGANPGMWLYWAE